MLIIATFPLCPMAIDIHITAAKLQNHQLPYVSCRTEVVYIRTRQERLDVLDVRQYGQDTFTGAPGPSVPGEAD